MIHGEKYLGAYTLKNALIGELTEAKAILDMPAREWRAYLEEHSKLAVDETLLYFDKCSHISILINRAIAKVEKTMDFFVEQEVKEILRMRRHEEGIKND